VISVAEAHAILRKACGPLGAEEVALREATGRVLARQIRSDVDWPPFDASAMDGYAVRVEDAMRAGIALAERPGVVGAGDSPGPPLQPGEAVRVMTGAPLPEGTGAVVPVEDVRREQGSIVPSSVPRPGEHVRKRGESVSSGSVLLSPGRRLGPSDIALAALAGAEPIAVHRRPRVTVAVTGNELVPVASRPGPAHLRDSNGPMLVALCASRGLKAAALPPVSDNEAAVDRLFGAAGREEDVLITTGGVSAGDFDLLPPAAERSGFQILFHRVAVRPGKPVAVGRRGETLWLGLPGNPVSASVCFQVFARLALDCLEGADSPGPAYVTARLTRDVAVRGRRETYRDARLDVVDGENRLSPLASRGSHDLGSHARGNALLRIPAEAERLCAGSLVECLPLPNEP
jgi:molybdopterin molybdotransferase